MVCAPVRRDNHRALIIDHTGAQTMLTCTTITSVDLAHHEVSRAKDWKDWVSVDCGTKSFGDSKDHKITMTVSKPHKELHTRGTHCL